MTAVMFDLAWVREQIERFAAVPPGEPFEDDAEVEKAVAALVGALEHGSVRAAERDATGTWRAVTWVKRGILLGFRIGRVVDMSLGGKSSFRFFDKHLFPAQCIAQSAGIRIVPGGSTIRRGAHVAKGVVCMPPMFINVGAYVDTGTMVDSHALVGSCAQIGKRVHVSAAAQIGGVLEPVNATPVIIEDDVFVGGNSGVYEGTIVRRRAVLATGVILTHGTPVYDLVKETLIKPEPGQSLEIPESAVVVPGSRAVDSEFGKERGLSLYAPMIVKYRDEITNASTALEQWLR